MGWFLEDNDCIYEAFLKSAFHNLWHALLTLCQSLWTTIQKSLLHLTSVGWQPPLHFVFALRTGRAMIPIL